MSVLSSSSSSISSSISSSSSSSSSSSISASSFSVSCISGLCSIFFPSPKSLFSIGSSSFWSSRSSPSCSCSSPSCSCSSSPSCSCSSPSSCSSCSCSYAYPLALVSNPLLARHALHGTCCSSFLSPQSSLALAPSAWRLTRRGREGYLASDSSIDGSDSVKDGRFTCACCLHDAYHRYAYYCYAYRFCAYGSYAYHRFAYDFCYGAYLPSSHVSHGTYYRSL